MRVTAFSLAGTDREQFQQTERRFIGENTSPIPAKAITYTKGNLTAETNLTSFKET